MGPGFTNVYDSTIAEDIARHDHSSEALAGALDAFAAADPVWNGPEIQAALAEKWVPVDSEAAARWAGGQPPGKARDAVLEQLRKYCLANADDTAAAADTLLVEQRILSRESLLESITALWPGANLDRAGEWLGQQGSGAETWPAVETFAKRAVNIDPPSAFAWLDVIADDTRRERAYGDVFDQWHAADPAEAEKFLLGQ